MNWRSQEAGHHAGGRGCCLRYDRRMVSNDWAGHSRAQSEPLRGVGDAADHGPDECRIALAVYPGMKVVGNHGGRKARLLGLPRMANQVVGAMLLAGEPISYLRHVVTILNAQD